MPYRTIMTLSLLASCRYHFGKEYHRVPDFAIGNSSGVHFSLGGLPPPQTPRVAVGGLRPPTPLRKVGLRPPWALEPILDGALGPMGPGPRLDLELFGPKMGFWEIEK